MEKQQELFGEFKENRSKNAFLGKGVLTEKTYTFIFTREKLILIIVGFIILSVIIFAFGFEQGKRGVLAKRIIMQPVSNAAVPARPLPDSKAKETQKMTPQVALKPYTIQVATFKSKELAQQEIYKLKRKGLPVTLIGINGMYQLWVGEYASYKEAAQALTTFKKVYKDCYIRKR